MAEMWYWCPKHGYVSNSVLVVKHEDIDHRYCLFCLDEFLQRVGVSLVELREREEICDINLGFVKSGNN